MEKLKVEDSFGPNRYAEEIVGLLVGRPKSFPPIYLLAKPFHYDELVVAEVSDAQWAMDGKAVEILTTCGEILRFNPSDKIREIRKVKV